MGHRAFCDRCEKETQRNFVNNRKIFILDGWKAEAMASHSGHYNSGVLCESCLMQIIKDGTEEAPTRSSKMHE